MDTSRRGVSPIVSSIVLILIAVGMAAGASVFLSQGVDRVIGRTDQVRLETVNVTCAPDRITWWLNNTGSSAVEGAADVFVRERGGLNASLSRTGIATGAGFTRAGGAGRLSVAPGDRMRLGQDYSLALEIGGARVSAGCTVGGPWWDAAWSYRRALQLDTDDAVTARFTLPAEQLVDAGKLRSDCADVRGVRNGEVVPYRVTSCDPDGTARVRVNLSGAEPGGVYVYYGNLQASDAGWPSLQNEGIVNVELGPEERVNLP
ncbi:MAG: archaellin/type IV pilin N-terminal domain-containing protein [Candidatus Nanohaloarchaea archaeon]